MNLKALAKCINRSAPFVMTMQKKYGLPACKMYSEGYAALLRKLVYLSIYSVPHKEIEALLSRERALLELLKVDSHDESPTWFENMCVMRSGATRLLLSGYDLGHMVISSEVQIGLDFAEREKELFDIKAMGADALRALKQCAETLQRIQSCLRRELSIVQAAAGS